LAAGFLLGSIAALSAGTSLTAAHEHVLAAMMTAAGFLLAVVGGMMVVVGPDGGK
jgi:uncharacterized lipoprotein YajG